MKRHAPIITLVIGIWLGGSIFLVAVVTYNFLGIRPALEVNEKLAARAGFDPHDDDERKTSVIWVYASELNRAFFGAWNLVQLSLGVGLLAALARLYPRRAALLSTSFAVAIVIVLTFYLGPRLVSLGRALDFEPRSPPPRQLAVFHLQHKVYSALEMVKIALVVATGVFVVRGADRQPKGAR